MELSPQCALNAVDHYSDAEFIVHFAGHKGRRKERLMQHFGALAAQRLETVASRLRFLGPSAMPVVHQTWKTHELEPRKKAWHASWARNGFTVQLHNDTECLDDVTRLAEQTGHPSLVTVYQGLTPVQRADFWRYAIAYLEGGIYSDIDIAATPETANFFLSLDQAQTDLVRTQCSLDTHLDSNMYALFYGRGLFGEGLFGETRTVVFSFLLTLDSWLIRLSVWV